MSDLPAATTPPQEVDAAHLLVVDDDAGLRDLLQRFLTREGFRVTVAAAAAEARERMQAFRFDLLVVDVMMPAEDGLSFVRALRREDAVPVLLLTAMAEAEQRIAGFRSGADDYLVKPFDPIELALRVRSILRRVRVDEEPASGRIGFGDFWFDPARRRLTRDGTPVHLTDAESALLLALTATPGRILSREELTQRCGVAGGVRAVDVQVARLRRKIEADVRIPRYLQTARGRGYVLRPDCSK